MDSCIAICIMPALVIPAVGLLAGCLALAGRIWLDRRIEDVLLEPAGRPADSASDPQTDLSVDPHLVQLLVRSRAAGIRVRRTRLGYEVRRGGLTLAYAPTSALLLALLDRI